MKCYVTKHLKFEILTIKAILSISCTNSNTNKKVVTLLSMYLRITLHTSKCFNKEIVIVKKHKNVWLKKFKTNYKLKVKI